MKIHHGIWLCLWGCLCVLSLIACASSPDKRGTSASDEQTKAESENVPGVEKIQLESIESVPMRPALEGQYDNIIFRSFDTTDQFQKDYPDASATCQASMIAHLISKKEYSNVTNNLNQKYPGKSVIVDMRVIDMRIAGFQARLWGGAFAGNSFMDVLLELKDADSEAVLHSKVLSTTNSAFGAAWTMGASDKSLPSDLGTLMAEYINRVVPGKN